MKKIKLLSIDEEAALCRTAFEGVEVGALVMHCHHRQWLEILSESAEPRIADILGHKHEHERAMRLHCFRPAPKKLLADAKRQEVYAKWRTEEAKWRRAYAKWRTEEAKWRRADANWWEAEAKWREEANSPAIVKLHSKSCACGWSKASDIFGKER